MEIDVAEPLTIEPPEPRGKPSKDGRRTLNNRSRVTNGKSFFIDRKIPPKSPWARRLKDIIGLHVIDQGGADVLSEARQSLIRRIAVVSVELERMEGLFAIQAGNSKTFDWVLFDVYQRGANTLNRLLSTIGIDRVPKDATPDLRSYLEATAAKEPPNEAAAEP